MAIRIGILLSSPLFLLTGACTDQLVVVPPQEGSFHHAPEEFRAGSDESGDLGAYEILALGTLGGSSGSVWAINMAGTAVGAAATEDNETRAFAWTRSRGIWEVKGLHGATHINESGQATGVSAGKGFVYHLKTETVAWLPGLPNHTWTQGIAINGDGMVVGRSARGLQSG